MAIRLSTGLRDGLLDTGALNSLLANAKLEYYTGAQPASADDAVTGTKLLTIDNTTGINFAAAAVSGTISKLGSETWSAAAIASGTAGYFRMSVLADANALSTTAVRIDGSIGSFGADLNLTSTNIVSGATQTVDAFDVTLPAA